MANYPEFVPLKFAIARTGAIGIPFNYLYRQDELGYVLDQSGCSVVITMTGFAGLDYLGMLDAITPGWDAEGWAGRGDLRHIVLLSTDGRTRPGPLTVEGLAALGDQHPDGAKDIPHRADEIGVSWRTGGAR